MENTIKEADLIGTPYEGFQIKKLVKKSTPKTKSATIEDFQKSMEEDLPVNIKTGLSYINGNEENLNNDCRIKNYKSHIWGTYLQYNELGYRVRKGEKSSEISHPVVIKVIDKNGKEKIKTPPKFFKVFNLEQVEKCEEKLKKAA